MHGEGVLNILCVVEDVDGSTSNKEHMGRLGVDLRGGVVVH